MAVFVVHRSARHWLFVPLVILVAGCGQNPNPTTGVEVRNTEPVSTEPGEIELSAPTATFAAPNTVRFEVNYRFTKGKPDKYYMCEIVFPGTPNHGSKPMESWELKADGTIKDGIVLSSPPVETFEIRLSEADSPQNGYKLISNVVRGPVK